MESFAGPEISSIVAASPIIVAGIPESPDTTPWVTFEEEQEIFKSDIVKPAAPEPQWNDAFKAFLEHPIQESRIPATQILLSPSIPVGAGAALLRPLSSVQDSGVETNTETLLLHIRIATLEKQLKKAQEQLADCAGEIGYYQGMLHAKQEQLRELPQIRHRAAQAIVYEHQLTSARQENFQLTAKIDEYERHILNRIVNGLLSGEKLHPAVQMFVITLIVAASSAITMMLLAGM